MRGMISAVTLALIMPLTACAGTGADGTAVEKPNMAQVTIVMGAQQHRFDVEVAGTIDEQARGMMFRTQMMPDGGMIFPFSQPKIASFWMKNTLIPLDIFFLRADGSIDRIAENAIPQSLEPIVSGGEVAAVLELAGGTAARLAIDESAKIRWQVK